MKPIEAGLPPTGVISAPVVVARGGVVTRDTDWLVEEVPVALVFNGISHAVMLASPNDLEDFALGFGLSEELLLRPSELYGVDVVPANGGIEVRMEVAAACEMRLKSRRRTLAGRTGCGLCGAESLDQIQRTLPTAPIIAVRPDAIARAQRGLRDQQAVQQWTGASHAAAWCGLDGDVRLAREDIGRHNALDKLIGAIHRAAVDATEGFVCVTSRASYEMVQKAAMSGAGLLAAVSAPTALAVQTARSCNLALAGFVREDDLVAYTFPERLGLCAAHADHE
jgi:FdhD protein